MGQHSRQVSQTSKSRRTVVGAAVAVTMVATGANAISLTDKELAKARPETSQVVAQQGHSSLPPYVDLNPVQPSDPDTPILGGTFTLGGPEKDDEAPSQGAPISPLPDSSSPAPVEDQQAAEANSGPLAPADGDSPPAPAEPASAFKDLDCNDFNSQEEAQAKLEENEEDIHDLDRDNDDLACEVTFNLDSQLPAQIQAETFSTSPKCDNLGVESNVVRACNLIVANVSDLGSIGGFGQRPNNPTSCHPRRLALDFGTSGSTARGDRIFAYVTKNKEMLGATTILWQVKDHYDHVHVSFLPCKN